MALKGTVKEIVIEDLKEKMAQPGLGIINIERRIQGG